MSRMSQTSGGAQTYFWNVTAVGARDHSRASLPAGSSRSSVGQNGRQLRSTGAQSGEYERGNFGSQATRAGREAAPRLVPDGPGSAPPSQWYAPLGSSSTPFRAARASPRIRLRQRGEGLRALSLRAVARRCVDCSTRRPRRHATFQRNVRLRHPHARSASRPHGAPAVEPSDRTVMSQPAPRRLL
jgi:hypothetical protein